MTCVLVKGDSGDHEHDGYGGDNSCHRGYIEHGGMGVMVSLSETIAAKRRSSPVQVSLGFSPKL